MMADPCPQELGADAPDTPDGAPALGVGSHRGCYGVDDPKDTFSITAPSHPGPVLYRFRLSGVGAQVCLVGKDADRANMSGLNGCGKNKDAQLDMWALVQGGTTWTLETRDLLGDSRKLAKPYTLDIQATPLADPGEPDSREQPVPLALGEAKQAFVVNAANVKDLDNDYFAVVVPNNMRKKGRFQVVISDVPTEVHIALQVFDADGRKLGGGSGGNPGATLRKELKMKGPGTYLFHVRNLSGEGRNIGGKDEPKSRALKPYTITVTAD